jgi:hypothetical protein
MHRPPHLALADHKASCVRCGINGERDEIRLGRCMVLGRFHLIPPVRWIR